MSKWQHSKVFFANKLAFSRAALIFRIGPIHSLYREFSMVYFLEKIIRFCKTYSFISPIFWHSLAGKTNKICTVEMSSDISKSCTFFVNFYSKKQFIDWINNEWTRWNLKTVFFGIQLLSKAKIIKILHQSNFERFVYESEDFVFFRMRINNQKSPSI